MPNALNSVDAGQNALALRRLQLEARVGEAIARAQKQYLQVQQQPNDQPVGNGPVHLGTKIDIRA